MMLFPTSTQERGFTLVETLVAIAIIMIAIVGPYYSIQQAIMTSYAARDQLIASALSQEGEEYIYFLRDTNYLNSADWLNGMSGCFGPNGCIVDPAQNTVAACSGTCSPLKLSTNGLYTQSGNYPATRFTRTLKIQAIPNSDHEVKVTVTVTWITEHRNFSVSTVENLYNWL
jgi:prepilin-type N-terminal cleavage/methylation domain-containing protein